MPFTLSKQARDDLKILYEQYQKHKEDSPELFPTELAESLERYNNTLSEDPSNHEKLFQEVLAICNACPQKHNSDINIHFYNSDLIRAYTILKRYNLLTGDKGQDCFNALASTANIGKHIKVLIRFKVTETFREPSKVEPIPDNSHTALRYLKSPHIDALNEVLSAIWDALISDPQAPIQALFLSFLYGFPEDIVLINQIIKILKENSLFTTPQLAQTNLRILSLTNYSCHIYSILLQIKDTDILNGTKGQHFFKGIATHVNPMALDRAIFLLKSQNLLCKKNLELLLRHQEILFDFKGAFSSWVSFQRASLTTEFLNKLEKICEHKQLNVSQKRFAIFTSAKNALSLARNRVFESKSFSEDRYLKVNVLDVLTITSEEIIKYLNTLANPQNIKELLEFTHTIDELKKNGARVIWPQIKNAIENRFFSRYLDVFLTRQDPKFIEFIKQGENVCPINLNQFQQQIQNSQGYHEFLTKTVCQQRLFAPPKELTVINLPLTVFGLS